MKKIVIVLLMALALVSIATAEVTLSGEFEYGMMVNSDDFSGKFDKIELDINADIDEFNSFSMELEDDVKTNDLNSSGTDAPMDINWATVTTDWGMLLDLPIGVKTTLGYDGIWVGDQLYATGWGFENYFGFYADQEAFGQLNLVFSDMVSLKTAVNFDPNKTTTDEYDAVAELAIRVAPVKVNLNYVTHGYDGNSEFGMEAVAGMDVAEGMHLNAATSFVYDMDTDAYQYGFGVGFGAMGAQLGVSFNGNDVDAIGDFGVDVAYDISETLTATVAALFDMRDTAVDAYQGTEVSLTYAAGAVSYTAGYAITEYGVSYNSETSLTDGGFFMAMALDY